MDKQFLDYLGLSKFSKKLGRTYSSVEKYTISIPIPWDDKQKTVADEFFLSSDRYAYVVSPSENSRIDYNNCGVNPMDITIDGQIKFECDEPPRVPLTVDILRITTKD